MSGSMSAVDLRTPTPGPDNPPSRPQAVQIIAGIMLAVSLVAGGVVVLDLAFPEWGLGEVATKVSGFLGALTFVGSIIAFVIKSTGPRRTTILLALVVGLVGTGAVAAIAYTTQPGEPAAWPTRSPFELPTSTPGPTAALGLRLLGVHPAHAGYPELRQAAGAVAFSPDGAVIATGGEDHMIRLWDTDTGTLVAELAGHEHRVDVMAFNPSTGELVSGSLDGTIRFWDVDARQQTGLMPGSDVQGLSFTRDGSLLAVGMSWRVDLVNPTTRTVVRSFPIPNVGVNDVAISPDGARVAAATVQGNNGVDEHAGYLWDTQSGGLVAKLTGHGSYMRGITFSHDGAQVLTAGFDVQVRRYDAATGALISSITDNGAGTNAVEFSPDGRYFAVADGWSVVLRDVGTGARITDDGEQAFASEMTDLAVSPDGSRIAAVSWQGELAVWAVTSAGG